MKHTTLHHSKRLWRWFIHLPRLLLAVIAAQLSLMIALFTYAWIRKRAVENPFLQLEYPEIAVGNHRVQVFDDGESVFEDMLAEIEQARETILLESYIFERDEVGIHFKKVLIRKAKQGVKVRIIFDGVGSLHVPARFKLFGWRRNIRVFEFGRLRSLHSFVTRQIWVRDHRKILVIDGKVAYLGGMNIGKAYARTWRDTQIKICGPMAANAGHAFAELWNRHNKRHTLTLGYAAVEDEQIEIVVNHPYERQFLIREMYLARLREAQHSVLITNAYFIPDREIIDTVIATAQRGVNVQIVMPEISDNIVVDWLARGLILELLKGGVRVLLYRGTMLHAKTMTVDGCWTTIGSANLDGRSMSVNYEINVVVQSEELARQMEAMYLNDCTQTREAELTTWAARPMLQQLGEWSLQSARGLF